MLLHIWFGICMHLHVLYVPTIRICYSVVIITIIHHLQPHNVPSQTSCREQSDVFIAYVHRWSSMGSSAHNHMVLIFCYSSLNPFIWIILLWRLELDKNHRSFLWFFKPILLVDLALAIFPSRGLPVVPYVHLEYPQWQPLSVRQG